MSIFLVVVLTTLAAGLAMPIGAYFASIERIGTQWLQTEFRHTIIAFGGGTLLAAVCFILVPEGLAELSPISACISFILGGAAFMLLDWQLSLKKTPASQLAAMLSDFIPESIALGAAFATGHSSAILLAALMGLQNLPEGFNAYHELNQSNKFSRKKILLSFSIMALLGPLCGILGFLWLSQQPEIVGIIMLFASGGILYSVFQDIAPQAKLKNHWAPPMGSVLGFVFGLLGFMLTNGH